VRRVLTLMAIGVMLVGMALIGRHSAPAVNVVVSGWHRIGAPVDEPFVGAWVEDGRLVTMVCLHYGDVYWEYAPTLLPPIGMCVGTKAPDWWIEVPGGEG
jgi:hypothetical protein